MLLLPKPNRDTAELVMVFFKWFATFNFFDMEIKRHVGLRELATMYGATFFGSPMRKMSATPADTLALMLENQDTLLRVPSELTRILEDRDYFAQFADASSKEMLKRCDSYMKIQGPTASLFSLTPSMFGSSISMDLGVSGETGSKTLTNDVQESFDNLVITKEKQPW